MLEKEVTIIQPPHVFDFSVLLPIFPDAVIVGEQLIRLSAIKSIAYEDVAIDDESVEQALVINYMSGDPDIFSDDQAQELESQIKEMAKRASATVQLQQENEQLKAELARRIMQDQAQGKILAPGFGNKRR